MENVSMDMIMGFLREFKADVDRRFELVDQRFEQIDKRFEQVDKRFEQVDKRFEQVDKRFEDVDRRFEDVYRELHNLRELIQEDKSKLQEVYDERNKVTITFSRLLFGANITISAIIATVISLILSR